MLRLGRARTTVGCDHVLSTEDAGAASSILVGVRGWNSGASGRKLEDGETMVAGGNATGTVASGDGGSGSITSASLESHEGGCSL